MLINKEIKDYLDNLDQKTQDGIVQYLSSIKGTKSELIPALSKQNESDNLETNVNYINGLLAKQTNHQLDCIKGIINENNPNVILQNTLDIDENNYICIGGYKIPRNELDTERIRAAIYSEDRTKQKRKKLAEYIEVMLSFTAQILGTKFDFSSNRTKIKMQDETQSHESFINIINSEGNKRVMQKLAQIIGIELCIPFALIDGNVILSLYLDPGGNSEILCQKMTSSYADMYSKFIVPENLIYE